jgi:hypothetical protein
MVTKHFFSMALASACLAAGFTGCSEDEGPVTGQNERIEVRLSSNIAGKTSQGPGIIRTVADNQFEPNDKVGFYMKSISTNTVLANNVSLSITSGQSLTADESIYYPESGNVNFTAYYPYSSSVGGSNTIQVSTGSQVTGLATEVLYSNNATNIAATLNPVNLQFRYSLAKLSVQVTPNFMPDDIENMTVSVAGLYTTANLSLTDGSLTNYDNMQLIELHKVGLTSSGMHFDALILPTNLAGTAQAIRFGFQLDNKSYNYTLGEGDINEYSAGTDYQLTFTIEGEEPPTGQAVLLRANIVPRNTESHNFTISHPID